MSTGVIDPFPNFPLLVADTSLSLSLRFSSCLLSVSGMGFGSGTSELNAQNTTRKKGKREKEGTLNGRERGRKRLAASIV